MEELIRQIRVGIENKLYFLGLYTTLTLPDICGATDSQDGNANGQKYKAWYNEYVYPNYNLLTDSECYNLRCKILHQGQSHAKKNTDYYTFIAFKEPDLNIEGGGIVNIGRVIINGQPGPKVITLTEFINAVLVGVEKWISEKRGTNLFEKNMEKFIKRNPNGIPPFWGRGTFIY